MTGKSVCFSTSIEFIENKAQDYHNDSDVKEYNMVPCNSNNNISDLSSERGVDPAFSSSIRTFCFPSLGTFSIHQSYDEIESSTGNVVWNAAIAMANFYIKEAETSTAVVPCRLLELGCGPGLVSLVASRLHSNKTTSIFATDGNTQVVQLARKNLPSWCNVSQLVWGNEDHMRHLSGSFDLILASDVLFQEPEALSTNAATDTHPLVKTLLRLGNCNNSKIWISYTERDVAQEKKILTQFRIYYSVTLKFHDQQHNIKIIQLVRT